ncbi:MAG: flagellar assembly protein FliW [Deltaproteobacteria bacterium]|nr:flagellar assembly protein FliW [Deltaproteobacteria bacterium]
MKITTANFGELDVSGEEIITFPEGILGFPELHRYCLVDPGDDTLILWLQSLDDARIAFAVLEPKIFKSDYIVKLSGQELKQLKLDNINQSIVFTILTIPRGDATQMTSNLKAPIVINLKEQIGKQVVLQENEYTLKHMMFRELKAALATIEATKAAQATAAEARLATSLPINLRSMVPSSQVKSL